MAFRGNRPKKKNNNSLYYSHTEEDLIAVVPGEMNDEWLVELRINKKTHTDPKVYTDKEALKKMYEYYKYYYDKYRN